MAKIPPLTALRALEAVAREGNITKAANRLFVTHSAVSHQIRRLENYLGMPILERHGPRVSLTAAGSHFAQVVSAAFDDIRRETDLLAMRKASPVSISTLPIVATQWLVPTLADFHRDHPDIPVHVIHDVAAPSMTTKADLSIRFSVDGVGSEHRTVLFSGRATAMCSPAYLAEAGPFETAFDLIRARLLQDEDGRMWKDWFADMGIAYPEIKRSHSFFFSGSSLLLSAALTGHGVAFCRRELVGRELADGQLIQLFERELDAGSYYYLVSHADAERESNATVLRQWLADQCAHPGRSRSAQAPSACPGKFSGS